MIKIPKKIKAVICDFDQTLIKFNVDWDILRQASAKIFKKYGFEVDYKKLRPIFEQTARELKSLENSNSQEEVISQIANELLVAQENFELKSVNSTTVFPDTKAFLEYASDQNLPIGLLTSNLSSVVKKIFSRFQVSFKGPIMGREQVKYPKPDSEGITKLLKELQLTGSSCMLVGDGDSDMEVAKKVGAVAVFLKRSESQYLSYSKPDFTINSLSEINFSY
ncbi:HAD family hydrolase [Candidatus Daviesbacteria bacterium]|nr:HAD family hydrolase [Candidatus Daviesbacteria bacterium]